MKFPIKEVTASPMIALGKKLGSPPPEGSGKRR